MDIDSGKLYTNTGDNLGPLEKLREQMSMIEIHTEELTDEEKLNMQVDLSSNTMAAGYARNFRNMRRFIEGKQGKLK